MEYLSRAKRNLNAYVEPAVRRLSLDTLDIAVLSVVLYFCMLYLWKNFHLFPQRQYWVNLKRRMVQRFLSLSFVASKIDSEVEKIREQTRETFRKNNPTEISLEMAEEGLDWIQIDKKMEIVTKPDHDLKVNGKLSGMYYAPKDEGLEKEIAQRSAPYLYYNLMHVDKVVGVRQIDSELVSFYLRLMKGDENSCGSTTSGGTESILVAIYSFREYARIKKGITEPELIMSDSAHSAFLKACNYFKIKAVRVPMDKETYTMNLKMFKKRINSNTIGVIASGGDYPHGLVDPIEKMAKIIKPYKIPMHVDCCLGGYAMIFSQELEFDVPKFNFEVPEVTTISIDPHKFGMAPKGVSLILFRNAEVKRAGIFVQEDWSGGVYGTSSITGSKPAASVVGAWISALKMGKSGYRTAIKRIHDVLIEIVTGLKVLPTVRVLGNPQLNTFSFLIESDKYNTFQVAEGMIRKGWYSPVIQHPSAIHMTLTMCNIDVAQQSYLKDVQTVVAELEQNPKLYEDTKSTQIYCSKMKVPDGCVLESALKSVIAEFSVA